MSHLAVVGSLNIDYFTKVTKLPTPGETVLAEDFVQRFGGKGANQAIAAARQDTPVKMIGKIGVDQMGVAYRNRLQSEGIDTEFVTEGSESTGSAFISVDAKGENTIVVAPGANAELSSADIEKARSEIESASALLLQFETTIAAVRRAVEIASDADVPVILNPSPLRSGFPWSELPIDYLIVNEGEAAQIDQVLTENQELLVKDLIITCGANPTLVYGAEAELEIPTISVKPIDTVGAGDAFAGAFASKIVEGTSLEDAIRYANIAGALATQEVGAQEAIPTRKACEEHASS